MILFNGGTGGLGAYLASALAARALPFHALAARLERRDELEAELRVLEPCVAASPRVVLLQLAARVSVPACESDPDAARAINVTHTVGTVRAVCDFGHRMGREVSVIYVGSGHVYAAPSIGERVTEGHPTGPRSVYAQTKLEAERALLDLAASVGASCAVARVFGLIAPRQPPHYVLPGLLRRVKEGRLDAIPGLSFARDYLDARDVCAILADLSTLPAIPFPVVNVCSGEPLELRALVRLLAEEARPREAEALLRGLGEAPGRPDDVPWLVGNADRVAALLGRRPRQIAPRQTARDAVQAAGGAAP